MNNKQFLTNHPPELGDIVVVEGGERWLCYSTAGCFIGLDRSGSKTDDELKPILALWRPGKVSFYGYPNLSSHMHENIGFARDMKHNLIAVNTPKSEAQTRIESAEKKIKEAQEELRLAREASK
jgi:hypothetical protein